MPRFFSLLDAAFMAIKWRSASVFESFEYSGVWPGTVNPNPQFVSPSIVDGFEAAGGWPGT